MNILFINDGSFYSGLVTELLCFNGYTVYEASYAASVRDVLRRQRVEVVLCYMPFDVSKSVALLALVRSHAAFLPCIAITTHSPSDQEQQQILALTSYCLVIPFATETLLHMIADATGIKKTRVSFRASHTLQHQNGGIARRG